jgi:signal transduction histidine kinase
MTIRTKLAAMHCVMLAAGVATTGYLLLREARGHSAAQILAQQQVYVESRAQTFSDEVQLLVAELRRLTRRAEVDLADNDVKPEAQLLSAAHEHSVLYNMGIRIMAADGRLLHAEPSTLGARGGDEIALIRGARSAVLDIIERPSEGAVLTIGVPVRAHGVFSGAIVGEVALAREGLLSHVLRPAPGEPPADVAIIDGRGIVRFSSAGASREGAFAPVLPLAKGPRRAGVLRRADAEGGDLLFAFARADFGQLTLVYAWPWKAVDVDLDRLLSLLWRILGAGLGLALVLGIAFAGYLTRPLRKLGDVARLIAEGSFPEIKPSARRDEIGALWRAFARMGESLRERDRRIHEDMEQIRTIAEERERLYREVEELASSLERRVNERTLELTSAQQRLLESERFAAMGEAAAAMAHELKNSLGGISMSVDLIMSQSAGGSTRVRHQLQEEIVRLRDITESLLDFAREPRLEVAPRDLNRIARHAADMLSELLVEQGAALELDLARAGAPLLVHCDGGKLEGVLINLLKNAAEAVGRSGHAGHVLVRTREQEGATLVEVEDDGAGISSDARARLFEPFFSTKPSGTGLGLATASRILTAHGGRIEALERQSGACFRLTLAAALPAAGETA